MRSFAPVMAFVVALVAAAGLASPARGATALVLIDIQDFYFPGGVMPLIEPEAASLDAARLLERFRQDGGLVIHVKHEAKEGGEIRADVRPFPGETVITKRHANAFLDTDLEATLRAHDVTRVVLCGMMTHMCLEATARAASDLGFEVVVVGDACATRDLTWGNRTVPAAEVQAASLAALAYAYATVVDTETYLSQNPPPPR